LKQRLLVGNHIENALIAQEGLAMSKISGRGNLAAILATVAVALSIGAGTAFAGDNNVTEDQILKALAPPPPKALTRGLSVGPQVDPAKVAEEGAFVQKIRNRATRSLSIGEREEIATIAKTKPNIDLEINFDYNSADISAKSMPSVQALGKALTNPDLKGSKYGIAGSDLVTVGYGKTKLKDPNQPMAEANRRVQVVNMQNKETASK